LVKILNDGINKYNKNSKDKVKEMTWKMEDKDMEIPGKGKK
jgi:hypothetical protein